MSLKQQLAKLHALLTRRKSADDLDDEIRSHLRMEEQENLEAAMSPDEAHYAALRRFGNVTLAEERSQEMWTWNSLETLSHDVRYGLRQLRRSPGFTAVAIVTLALGIGANTAIFSMVNAVVLHPLPYPHSDRLIWITERVPELKSDGIEPEDLFAWRERDRTLDQFAGTASTSFNMTGRAVPARVHGAYVSASFFAMLGAEPQVGRGFTEKEDRPGGANVVVLMHSFWQQYFGSDPCVLGQNVILDAVPHAVVGVMPASFHFPGDSEVQMLVPVQGFGGSGIVGRLKPGVTLALARNELDAIRKNNGSTARYPDLF